MSHLDEAAVIGLGANLEKPLETLRQALRQLEKAPGLTFLAASPVYLTEPQGGPAGQNWYHNAVVFFRCELCARSLMNLLLEVERSLGRERLEHWGPRVVDLDLLALGRQVINEPPYLIVPHPRMEERLFVMAPLADTAPGWVHPLSGKSAAAIMAGIERKGQGIERTGLWLQTFGQE